MAGGSCSRRRRSTHGIPHELDLLMEMLSWLPGKSLMRFKSVSKHWFSLISDPIFLEMHQTRSYVRKGGIFLIDPWVSLSCYCLQKFLMIDWTGKNPQNPTSIHELSRTCSANWVSNIVNGLICLDMSQEGSDKECISVYNFTTREILPLPPLRRRGNNPCCQLGFDPVNKVYKVLHFWQPITSLLEKFYRCEVFTLGGNDNRWRSIKISRRVSSIRFSMSLYYDGFLYWKSYKRTRTILTFNVELELFEFIAYPQGEMCDKAIERITLLEGHLSLVAIPPDYDSGSVITLWRLIDRKDKDMPIWDKEFVTLPFQDIGSSWKLDCSDFGLISFLRDSPAPNQVVFECCLLATGEHEKVDVNNAQGLLKTGYRFCPTKLVENIMSLNNIGGGHMIGIGC